MSSPTCMMGEYGISLVKNGIKLGTAGAKIRRIELGRVLDGISTATVDLITAGADCCGQLAAVDHWNTELVITATNPVNGRDDVLWRGPVRKPTFRRGSVTIEATDILSWLQVRMYEQDSNFVSMDTSDIFIALATYAFEKGGAPPLYEFIRFDSGTIESRVAEASALRMTWNIVTEMLEAGLDVTAFGSRVIVGVPGLSPLNLTDSDVLGSVEVTKDGDDYLNRAIGNASRDIVGIYPPGPPAGQNGYPLVEGVVVDSQLPDIASAQAAAKARYDFAENGVRRVRATGGLVLLPSSGIDARTLVPGQLINFAATETCYSASETLRLGKLTIVVEKGRETATIDLQPVGGVAAA